MKNSLFKSFAIVLFTIFLSSCGGHDPVPKEKESFIGVWQSPSGFQIEILPEGYANVYQPLDSLHPEYKKLSIRKANAVYNFGFEVEFLGDTALQLKKPYMSGRIYSVSRTPFMDADTMKLILNGVTVRKFNEDHFMLMDI